MREITRREVANLEFHLVDEEAEFFDDLMIKINDYADCSNETLIEELTDREHRYIINCLKLEAHKDFYDNNKAYCIYLFANKLLTYIFNDNVDEEYVYYLEGLVKVIKNYYCD